MIRWIRTTANILAVISFFLVFFVSLDPDKLFDALIGLQALIKGGVAFFVFLMSGYVLGDIIMKGLVETISARDVPATEGGLVQHIRDEHDRMDPENAKDTPVVKKIRHVKAAEKSTDKVAAE